MDEAPKEQKALCFLQKAIMERMPIPCSFSFGSGMPSGNVEYQLETAKTEVAKPFAQEAELAQKLERLSALNALLNMDEKGDVGIKNERESKRQVTIFA